MRIDPKDNAIYRVDIVQSEEGWGQTVVEEAFFDNFGEAEKYRKDFNNSQDRSSLVVPSCYSFATGPHKIL